MLVNVGKIAVKAVNRFFQGWQRVQVGQVCEKNWSGVPERTEQRRVLLSEINEQAAFTNGKRINSKCMVDFRYGSITFQNAGQSNQRMRSCSTKQSVIPNEAIQIPTSSKVVKLISVLDWITDGAVSLTLISRQLQFQWKNHNKKGRPSLEHMVIK